MKTHEKLQKAGFSLERNGGVWQYRSRSKYISLSMSNSYSKNEVIKYVNDNYNFLNDKLIAN